MKSKMKNLLAGVLMAFAILLLPQTIQAAETISVTTVDDITDVKDVTSTDYQVGTGEYSNLVKFTLSKPAYVYVSAYSLSLLIITISLLQVYFFSSASFSLPNQINPFSSYNAPTKS